ncbi:MAG TPA: PQQ-binding-like beta-propeller repeat protein [Armatimonadota bacterium]|jgi:hypothetical protein
MFPKTTSGKFLIILAASLALVGPLFLTWTVHRPRIVTAADDDKQLIRIQWRRAASEPICLTMTQDGKFIGSVDKSGVVRFFDGSGKLLWQKRVEGATDMLIARNGQSVLVYSKLNPVYTEVSFFRGNGFQLWRQRVDGCIWAGAVSPDGNYAAVTTGSRFVYAYSPDPNHPKFRRWRIKGIGRCVAFTPDNQSIIIGTWQKSGLVSYSRTGDRKWSTYHNSEKQYDLKISADGKMVMGIIPGRYLSPGVELGLWTSTGKPLWQFALSGYEGTALISPASEFVALSYASIISHKSKEIIERKVAVYKADGELAWEKGGLFFGPRLVALSPKGSSVIVWDGEKSLYNMDRKGRISSRLELGGKVRKTLSTEDGRKILLYCGDGTMYLLNAG